MTTKRVVVGDEGDKGKWRSLVSHTHEEVFGFFGPYRFLSNFFLVEIPYCGYVFPSSENAYQAVKFLPSAWHRFVDITPAEAKYLAHHESMSKHKRFNEDEWKRLRRPFMKDVVDIKFGLKGDQLFGDEGPELQRLLLNTGDMVLSEGNWWGDTFFGVCINEAGERVGENHLGRILMETRTELQARMR